MKKNFLFLFLMTAVFHYSQLAEKPSSENGDKSAYYKPGEAKLYREFERALSYAVDQNYYVHGLMTFSIFIDENGKAKIIDVEPKVKNHKLLMDDLNYVLKKSHKNWEPAQKDSKPVQSFCIFKIDFNTEVYDHD